LHLIFDDFDFGINVGYDASPSDIYAKDVLPQSLTVNYVESK